MIGQTILHYKILAKLGEGGMGEVYLAEDSKLERRVALKFLPAHYTENIEINARFQREAKAAAKLNHPNIITIHEIGEHEGRAYIAMEYVDGQSLREAIVGRTGRSPLQMPQIIDILSQVCAGLAKAHQAGIVHRDLKPENLMLDADGTVKILDFGLAQMQGKTRLTVERSTMGTLYYMSPEQFEGVDADHRADIWAVGVMLYEMVTGRLPFEGKHEHSIIYSITNKEPEPLKRHDTGVFPDLQRIVDKALDKDRDTRYQAITELLADLDRVSKSESVTAKRMSGRQKRKVKRLMLRYAAMAAVVVIAVVTGISIFNKHPVQIVSATHTQLTFTGTASYPAISPDGKFMAYYSGEAENDGRVDDAKVMVQDLDGGQALEIFSNAFASPHGFGTLRWSPDGSEVLFRRKDGSTSLIPRLGGSTRYMRTAPFACWSPDGSQIASISNAGKTIWFTHTSSGETYSISLTGDIEWMMALDWSPLGNRLLVLTASAVSKIKHSIRTVKIDGSQQQIVVEDSVELKTPHWSPDGNHIYYFRPNGQTKDLLKIKVNLATGEAQGPVQVLKTGLQTGDFLSLSSDGKRLLYARKFVSSNLWLVTLEGVAGTQSIQTKQLTTGTSWIRGPRLSPDGKRVAFSIGSKPKANIFVMPVEGGAMQQLTFLDSYNSGAAWSPDGKELVFGSTEGGKGRVWRIGVDGGTPRQFQASEISDDVFDLTWHPGRNILYRQRGNRNFHILDPQTEEERTFLSNPNGFKFDARYSPGGDNVAFFWNRDNRGLWLSSLADSLQTLLFQGSLLPIEWSANGEWVYAWEKDKKPNKIIMVSLKSGKSRTLVTLPFDRLDSFEMPITMTLDGKRIICAVTETQSDIWLMENFDPDGELETPISLPEPPEIQQLTFLQKGVELLQQKKFEEAERTFSKGLELNHEHLELQNRLGWSLNDQKKYQESETIFREALKQNPEHPELLNGLGWSLYYQKKYGEAEEAFRQGLKLNPKRGGLLNGIRRAAIENKRYGEAKRYSEELLALATAPSLKRSVHSSLGAIGILLKDFDYSEKHYRNALALDSTDTQAIRGMGYLFIVQERYKDAEQYAFRALALDSSFANYNLAAWVLVAGEIDLDRGMAFAEKALASQPETWQQTVETYPYLAFPEHTLGLVYLKKGDYEKAVQYLEQAADFAPEWQAIRDDLQHAKVMLQEMANK